MRTYQIISVSQEGHVDSVAVDSKSLGRATVAWKSKDALDLPEGRRRSLTIDPPEQAARCLTCPIPEEEMQCGEKCWYRLGLDAPPKKKSKPNEEPKPKAPKKPKPPVGYDREALDRAMAHAYTDKELSASLGIGVWRVRKWLEWRYR